MFCNAKDILHIHISIMRYCISLSPTKAFFFRYLVNLQFITFYYKQRRKLNYLLKSVFTPTSTL